MSSYAINKALFEIRKRNGLRADERDYPENYINYQDYVDYQVSKGYDVSEINNDSFVYGGGFNNSAEIESRLDILERKMDILISMVSELKSDPPVKQLVKPIVMIIDPDSSNEQIEEKLKTVI